MRRDVCLSVWGQRPATDSIWLSILLLAPSISQVHSQLKTKQVKNQQQKRVEKSALAWILVRWPLGELGEEFAAMDRPGYWQLCLPINRTVLAWFPVGSVFQRQERRRAGQAVFVLSGLAWTRNWDGCKVKKGVRKSGICCMLIV
ncbi:hypothetical protein CI102_424 [Trichoderma harzianum]|nr:hypothetical protein CI102_424 [Trichoderma harzianum]